MHKAQHGHPKIDASFSPCVDIKLAMFERLPKHIHTLITRYIPHEVQAADPRCYRASRRLQSAWRGWVIRYQKWRCKVCGKREFLGITGRLVCRITFAALPERTVRAYMPGGSPFACYACMLQGNCYHYFNEEQWAMILTRSRALYQLEN